MLQELLVHGPSVSVHVHTILSAPWAALHQMAFHWSGPHLVDFGSRHQLGKCVPYHFMLNRAVHHKRIQQSLIPVLLVSHQYQAN